jgi:hypothetical protein
LKVPFLHELVDEVDYVGHADSFKHRFLRWKKGILSPPTKPLDGAQIKVVMFCQHVVNLGLLCLSCQVEIDVFRIGHLFIASSFYGEGGGASRRRLLSRLPLLSFLEGA